MLKFSKSELMEELREIIYQYARGVSFALEGPIGYQVLFGGKRRTLDDDVLHFMNPELNAQSHGEPFSIDNFSVTKSMGEFYDYGLLGIRSMSAPVGSGGANEWTFAYAFVRDASKSILISEACNGDYVDAPRCLHAAKAFFARQILDGNERTYVDGLEGPADMLTISEVAILADLDERTVRNATSKNAANRLETAVVDSNIYIPREAALAWLQTKRGFNPTRMGEELTAQAVLLEQEFTSVEEAGDFVRQNRERVKLDYADLAKNAGSGWTVKKIKDVEAGLATGSEEEMTALGAAIGLNGQLFALRVAEASKKQEIQALRRRIFAASSNQ